MFEGKDIEMGAVLGCALPGGSFKLPGIASLIDGAKQEGALVEGDVVVEASSGRALRTIINLLRGYTSNTVGVMKQDVPTAKRGSVTFAGANVVTPDIGLTPVETARRIGGGGWVDNGWKKNGNILNLDQYGSPYLKLGYRDWGAAQIVEEFGDFDVLVVAIGTGGTLLGLAEGLENLLGHKVVVVGVLCADRQEIPGMRDRAGMRDIKHPWEAGCDHVVTMNRQTAFLCAPWLDWGIGANSGPSGGAAYAAACQFAYRLIDENRLDEVRVRKDKTGPVKMLFVIHDSADLYVGDRLSEFSLDNFHPSTARTPYQLIFCPDGNSLASAQL